MVEHNESRTEKCKPPTVQRYMALRHRAATVSWWQKIARMDLIRQEKHALDDRSNISNAGVKSDGGELMEIVSIRLYLYEKDAERWAYHQYWQMRYSQNQTTCHSQE